MRLNWRLLLLLIAPLGALPQNPEVIAGDITSSQNHTHIIQGSDKAIVNWDSFSIAAHEHVQFVQPSSSSVVLNRVIGQNASEIFGTLTANGHVFLINPQGVLFGPHSSINTAGLLVSTLHLTNEDFLHSRYKFTGEGGTISNQGHIAALNHITLIAGQVTNEGSLTVSRGVINLAAGKDVSLALDEQGLLSVSIDREALQALVVNKGNILADTITLSGKSASAVYEHVVNNQGIITANSISQEGGRITLKGGSRGVVEASGTLKAPGGRVHVSGAKTFMASGGVIDVSHKTEAGSVLLWADDKVSVHGYVNASSQSKGGFVEVSTATQHFSIEGFLADCRAPKRGSFLLDPVNLTIDHSSTTSGSFSGGDPDIWTSSSTTATLGDSVINTQLATANVILDTTQGAGAGSGTITITDNDVFIPIPADTTLTFICGSGGFSIDQTASLTTGIQGPGSFIVDASGPVNMNGTRLGTDTPLEAFTVENCSSYTQSVDIPNATTVSINADGSITGRFSAHATTNLNITSTGAPSDSISLNIAGDAPSQVINVDTLSIPTSFNGINVVYDNCNLRLRASSIGSLSSPLTVDGSSGSGDILIYGNLIGSSITLRTSTNFSIFAPTSLNLLSIASGGSLTTSSGRLSYGSLNYSSTAPLNVDLPSSSTIDVTLTIASSDTGANINFTQAFNTSQFTNLTVPASTNVVLTSPSLTVNSSFGSSSAPFYLASSNGNLNFTGSGSITGSNIFLSASGSIFNNSSANPIINTTGPLGLSAGQVAGTGASPLTVFNPTRVDANAHGTINSISIDLSGSIQDNTIHFPYTVPGYVIFNGVNLNPFAFLPTEYLSAIVYVKAFTESGIYPYLIEGSLEKQRAHLRAVRNSHLTSKGGG